MRKLGRLWVLEVRKGKVEEVDNLEEQSPSKVGTRPQMDEAELQQVVVRECRCQVGSRGERLGGEVRLEQGGEVGDLQDVEHDPVDAHDYGVESEGCVVGRVLAPDLAALVVAFMG